MAEEWVHKTYIYQQQTSFVLITDKSEWQWFQQYWRSSWIKVRIYETGTVMFSSAITIYHIKIWKKKDLKA